MSIVRKNLAELRELRGMSNKELANKSGRSYKSISQINSGAVGDIHLSTLVGISKGLDVPTDMLCDPDAKEIFKERNKKGFAPHYIDNDDLLAIFADNVRTSLKRKHKYQFGITTTCGITPANLSRILNGETKDPYLSTLQSVSKYLDKDLSSMFRRGGSL